LDEAKVEKSEKAKRQRRLVEEHLRQKMTEKEIEALALILKVKSAED